MGNKRKEEDEEEGVVGLTKVKEGKIVGNKMKRIETDAHRHTHTHRK